MGILSVSSPRWRLCTCKKNSRSRDSYPRSVITYTIAPRCVVESPMNDQGCLIFTSSSPAPSPSLLLLTLPSAVVLLWNIVTCSSAQVLALCCTNRLTKDEHCAMNNLQLSSLVPILRYSFEAYMNFFSYQIRQQILFLPLVGFLCRPISLLTYLVIFNFPLSPLVPILNYCFEACIIFLFLSNQTTNSFSSSCWFAVYSTTYMTLWNRPKF